MLRPLLVLLVVAGSSADDDAACVPQYTPYPVTCIDCPANVYPQDVPFDDISKLWGTWYTIGAELVATDPQNTCTQLNFSPSNESDIDTDLLYLASYNQEYQPYGPQVNAQGGIFPTSSNFSATSAPYQLQIPIGIGEPQDFWFVATDGDSEGNGITALVTLSCPKDGQNSQMFVLSRKPYFVAPTTFDTLQAKAGAAVANFNNHSFTLVKQAQGWCDYVYPEER